MLPGVDATPGGDATYPGEMLPVTTRGATRTHMTPPD